MELIFVVLAVILLIGVVLIFFGKSKDEKQKIEDEDEPGIIQQPPIDSLPPMTLKQLSEYDGKKNSKVYLACKGIVFDVSKSEFYVGDGGYAAFAGKDCSVNLARMSFDEKDYNQYGQIELTLSERDTLDSWYDKYITKYQMVAAVSENKKDSRKDN